MNKKPGAVINAPAFLVVAQGTADAGPVAVYISIM